MIRTQHRFELCMPPPTGPMVSFCIFCHAVTLVFDLLTPKPNQFDKFCQQCILGQNLLKIRQCVDIVET